MLTVFLKSKGQVLDYQVYLFELSHYFRTTTSSFVCPDQVDVGQKLSDS